MCSTRPAKTHSVPAPRRGALVDRHVLLTKELDYWHLEERLYHRTLQPCG